MKQPHSRAAKIEKMIRGAMLRRDIASQTELAEYSGMTQPTISKKFNGTSEWTVGDFWKLDKVLKFERDEFYVLLEAARK